MAKLYGKMRFLSSIRIVRVTLALAVTFWMAGGGCMLGCEIMATAAPAHAGLHRESSSPPVTAGKLVVAGEACASMRSHDCCAKRGSHAAPKVAAKPSAGSAVKSRTQNQVSLPAVVAQWDAPFSTMMDCPLAVNATAALSKARPDEYGGALLPAPAADSHSYLPEQLTALSPPSRLPNRGHTYLRCCVFLI